MWRWAVEGDKRQLGAEGELTGTEESVTLGRGGDGGQLVDHLRDEGAHLSRARIRVRARVRARIRARVRVRVRVRRPALGQVP